MLTFNFNAVLHSLHTLRNRVSTKRVFFWLAFVGYYRGIIKENTIPDRLL